MTEKTEPKAEEVESSTQIVRVLEPSANIALPPAPTKEEIIQQAADQIYIYKQYMKLLAAEVSPEQVLLFGEEIYLPKKVCQKLLGFARLRVKIHAPLVQHRFNSPDGEFIVFEAHATICDRMGNELDDVVASQSTRDEFLGMAGKVWTCPKCKEPVISFNKCKVHGDIKADPVTHYLPLYDVPIDDIIKKTTTNLFNRALQAIGMMPSLEDLREAGMDISKVKRIGFKSQSEAPKQSPPKQQASSTGATASQPPAQGSPSTSTTQEASKASPPTSSGAAKATGVVKGVLLSIETGITVPKDKTTGQPTGAPGRPFLNMSIGGNRVNTFKNSEMAIDTRGNKKHAFVLLAESKGKPVELKVSQSTRYTNVEGYIRIGDYEWSEDGTPVLRRLSAEEERASAEQTPWVASDEDIPF